MPETHNPWVSVRKSAGKRRKWVLPDSMWTNRPGKSVSKDFYETGEAMKRLVLHDWSVVKDRRNLDKFVSRAGGGGVEILEVVRQVLVRHMRTLYGTFDYYAALLSDNLDAAGARVNGQHAWLALSAVLLSVR